MKQRLTIRRFMQDRPSAHQVKVAAAVLGLAASISLLGTSGSAHADSSCTSETGPYQQQLEAYLRLLVDGVQSPSDCSAIKKFQIDNNIYPQRGYAGPITYAKVREREKVNPNEGGECPTNKGRIACVNLSRQIMWVQKGSGVIFGPVDIRSGRSGYETHTGLKRIYWRHKEHVSSIYKTPMPYSQFFHNGEAFHAVSVPLNSPPGSHGCVNMTDSDAKKLWDVLKLNDYVYLWGKRPGA